MAGRALKCVERIMDKFVNGTPQVIYQKESIDYDKLAEAIVKAQEQIRQKEKEEQETLERELAEKSKYTRNTLAIISSWILRLLSVLGFLFGIVILVSIGIAAYETSWSLSVHCITNGLMIVAGVSVGVGIFMLSWLWKKAAKEIDVETDRYYVAAVFSGLMAAIAVIVAIIGLIIAK